MSARDLQEIVCAVQELLFPVNDCEKNDQIQCGYANGMKLQVRKEYLLLDDHKLKNRVFEAVAPLQRYRQGPKDLIVYITEDVKPDNSEYIPEEIVKVFSELLAAEP
jgi:hypothetical protein